MSGHTATRGKGTPRECPVGTCGRVVRAGHLMCGAHWAQVPREVQSNVWRTWRTFNRTSDDADWQAYAHARQAALLTVQPQEITE